MNQVLYVAALGFPKILANSDSLDTVVLQTAGHHLKGPASAPSVMENSGTIVVKSISLVTTPGLIVKGILSLLLNYLERIVYYTKSIYYF